MSSMQYINQLRVNNPHYINMLSALQSKYYKMNLKEKESKKNIPTDDEFEELLLLSRIDCLPTDIQMIVGSFSPVVVCQRFLAKYEFFDNWIVENTDRIMSILETMTKPQIGFILNSIIQLGSPSFVDYLKGGVCYNHWTSEHMRKDIKVYISHRTRVQRRDIIEDLTNQKTYIIHKFIPCIINPEFDKYPVRVYGAYKAIEEFSDRLKMKKGKKEKKEKKSRIVL